MEPKPSDFEQLASRVDALEKQNRWLKRGGAAVLLSLASLIVMGQARPATNIDAQSYTLRDAKGAKRAQLLLDSDSPQKSPDPTLRFFDEKGNQTVLLSPARLELSGQSDAGTNILLDDAKGTTRANLGLTGDQSFLLLNDSKGVPRVRVDLDHGQPDVALQNAQQVPVVGMGIIDGEPTIGLDDPEGNSAAIGSTPVVTNGKPHRTSAASIMLFGKDGSLLWSAPGGNN
jgi:hypothetical protein